MAKKVKLRAIRGGLASEVESAEALRWKRVAQRILEDPYNQLCDLSDDLCSSLAAREESPRASEPIQARKIEELDRVLDTMNFFLVQCANYLDWLGAEFDPEDARNNDPHAS